ncbi:hypothetical protein OSTOST_12084 [Ostertagia ostertagi]
MLAEFAVFAILGVSHSLLMFDRVDSENACLLAMCDADSGCVPKGCSIDQNNRIGCGYFRLNIYQFRQQHQPCEVRGKERGGGSFEHGSEEHAHAVTDHNYNTNSMNTAFYWKRVGDICGGRCNKPIFVRH